MDIELEGFKMKTLLTLLFTATVCVTTGLSAELSKTIPEQNHRLVDVDKVVPNGAFYPLKPGVTTDSPGIVIGTTFYPYQTNGSTGNRIAICDDGSIYFFPVPRGNILYSLDRTVFIWF